MSKEQLIDRSKLSVDSVSVAEQSWFIEFLASKGFKRLSSETFTREKAKIEVKGMKLRADPGVGDKTWNADLRDAEPGTIRFVIEQVLKMRPFLSEAELSQERNAHERVQSALTGLGKSITEGPETHSGVQLRRFLWSLYNGHHLVNLWRMTSVLDSTRAAWVTEVFAGAFIGVLKEDEIKRALVTAGEMRRWDEVEVSDETQGSIADLIEKIATLLRTIPPSRAHAEMNRAREYLSDAQQALHRAKQAAPEKST